MCILPDMPLLFLYIYLILKFESEMPRNALMLWACFFLGLTVDIFRYTRYECCGYGVFWLFYALLSCLFVPRDTFENIVPSIKSMGIVPFLKYLVVSVFIHHAILLTIEFFFSVRTYRNVAAENCGKYVADCNLYHGYRRSEEEVRWQKRLYTRKAEISDRWGSNCD